jgi:hypothetical protein
MKRKELYEYIREEIINGLPEQKSKKTLSEAEIQVQQKTWDEYNKNLDKMIELGKQLIKSYGREI